LERIQAPVLAINSADDERNLPEIEMDGGSVADTCDKGSF
jgi:hypothetical protein